jgi:glycosyltransferase involved in cell wall biosynthesis
MDTPVKVSVIVPTYNRAQSIGNAIQSVLDQSYTDLELIVVDDGSKDDTAERIAAFTDPRLRYIRQPNGGVSAARNRGVAEARGELVAFLDSDDIWKPEKLAADVTFLDWHPRAQAVFSDVEKFDGTLFVPSFVRETPIFGTFVARNPRPEGMILDRREMFLCLLREVPILPSTLTMRRDVLQRLGGFSTSWRCFEDWELFIRFSLTERFGYIDRAMTVLRISPDSLHRVLSETGRTAIIAQLLQVKANLGDDPEAHAAVRDGILHQRKMLGWHYGDAGRRGAAAINYLRGFLEVGSLDLLVRAIVVWTPRWIKRRMRRRPRIALADGRS